MEYSTTPTTRLIHQVLQYFFHRYSKPIQNWLHWTILKSINGFFILGVLSFSDSESSTSLWMWSHCNLIWPWRVLTPRRNVIQSINMKCQIPNTIASRKICLLSYEQYGLTMTVLKVNGSSMPQSGQYGQYWTVFFEERFKNTKMDGSRSAEVNCSTFVLNSFAFFRLVFKF